MLPVDRLEFRGHPNILATHPSTIELTTENEISLRADCIVGVSATKACSDLNASLKQHIWNGKNLDFSLIVEGDRFSFEGKGIRTLSLSDTSEIVFRRSKFVSSRTGAISCSAAAIDVPRSMVQRLRSRDSLGILEIRGVSD